METGTETDNRPEAKVCSMCGETFGCGARLDGCWCTDVTVSQETVDSLKADYDDCLCPKCLGSLAAKEP